MTSDTRRGHHADSPTEIPKAGWIALMKRVFAGISANHLSTISAGVAFFGLFAIFPAIGAVVAIAGLILDPVDVQGTINDLSALLPESAATIISDQVEAVVSESNGALGLATVLALLLSLYSASSGMKTMMDGLNAAYSEKEERNFLIFNLVALGLTLLMIVAFIFAVGTTLVAPVLLEAMSMPSWISDLVTYLRWPVFAVFTILGLAVVYRYGPSRQDAKWRWISPGAVVAMVIWVLFSLAFAIYVRNFGSYTETYGTLGGVIILLTWLWLSAFIILLGAQMNAEMEHQTEEDTTTGPPEPMGERGAHVADTPPSPNKHADKEAGLGSRTRSR